MPYSDRVAFDNQVFIDTVHADLPVTLFEGFSEELKRGHVMISTNGIAITSRYREDFLAQDYLYYVNGGTLTTSQVNTFEEIELERPTLKAHYIAEDMFMIDLEYHLEPNEYHSFLVWQLLGNIVADRDDVTAIYNQILYKLQEAETEGVELYGNLGTVVNNTRYNYEAFINGYFVSMSNSGEGVTIKIK